MKGYCHGPWVEHSIAGFLAKQALNIFSFSKMMKMRREEFFQRVAGAVARDPKIKKREKRRIVIGYIESGRGIKREREQEQRKAEETSVKIMGVRQNCWGKRGGRLVVVVG